MPPSPEPPRQVLARYGAAVAGVRWVPLGSAGGLSGALLWRGDAGGRPALALKGWPPDITAARLAEVHALLRRAGRLPFVPAVVPAADGATAVESSGRVWDLCRWMPGAADFHADPTPGRLANAAAALTAVHRELAPAAPRA
ncbi:MAG: hypothetical protein K2X82_21770, partial [Gemmataceae bacterium]|nr:hypothetical protein [Gemmataceae bacterium]